MGTVDGFWRMCCRFWVVLRLWGEGSRLARPGICERVGGGFASWVSSGMREMLGAIMMHVRLRVGSCWNELLLLLRRGEERYCST
jgi:hypothetical protein